MAQVNDPAENSKIPRRNLSALGAKVLIFGLPLGFLGFTFFIEGFGLLLSITSMVITSIIARQSLPPKQVSPTVIISAILSLAILLLDLFLVKDRATLPVLRTYVPFILGGLILIYGFFIARQFANYSLRTKLITVFLVISLLSVGSVALVTDWVVRTRLTESVGLNLRNIANTQALAAGNLLARQVDVLNSLALNRVVNVELGLFHVNSSYPEDPAQIQAMLLKQDQEWQTADESSLLVQSRLVGVLASELLRFQQRFPDHVEVFVTDQYGALVAATNPTSDYYQADETWWQAAYNQGQGATYIGIPEYDESSATYGINLAVPVYGANNRTIVGVLRSTYRLASLQTLLASVELGQTGHMDLLLPGGYILALDGSEVEPIDQVTFGQLQDSAAKIYEEFPFEGGSSLVSQSPVLAITGEQVIADLGWRVVVHQGRQEALAPVQVQQNSALLIALVIAGITVVMAIVVAQLLVRPISRLTETAQQVATGNLTARAQIKTGDETGLLAHTFNLMTERLQETVDMLEERVVERTRQLETVVEISQRLTGILDLSDLLRQVVILTKETFHYYHTHIYLMDERGEMLLMTAGYGEAGNKLRAQGHSIPINAPKSLVARSAREGKVVTVENVRLDPDWLPNPLLPNTYSEMAVPVMLGNQVVGILDVQSEKIGGLTHEDEVALQALANQVATAVRNARLFTQTQEALYEAQRLQQLYTSQAWEKLGAARTLDYEFRQANLPALAVTPIPEAVAALQQKRTVDLRTPVTEIKNDQDQVESQSPLSNNHAALATPLKLRDQVIGVLGIHCDDPHRRWSDDEIALIEAVSEQMSLAIENARLFEETGRRAGRERIIADITQQVWASGELERVMQTAVEQLGAKLEASKVVIRLGTEEQLLAGLPSTKNSNTLSMGSTDREAS